eukprot:scaffold8138_cov277-Pinguiococcus_pyrenoidosus.AAC.4
MPMVGISSASVMALATGAGTHSSTMAKAPASCMRRASSSSSRAFFAVRPCARKPPMTLMACGVRPTCAMTAMPPSTIFLKVSARLFPPSIFTASMPPSLMKRYAFLSASSCDTSYEPNGMSPTSSGADAPRETALQWCSMSSIVTGCVVA